MTESTVVTENISKDKGRRNEFSWYDSLTAELNFLPSELS
jgi:hypothetical protein